jgi:hypothetical protein
MTVDNQLGAGGEHKTEVETMFRFPLILALVGLALGMCFEILFFGHPIGISFSIMALLCIGALLFTAWREGIPFASENLFLGIPILFFSIMTFLRTEPMTLFLNIVITLMLFALWVRTFRLGGLLDYGWLDMGLALLWVPLEAWIRPWSVLGKTQKKVFKEGQGRGVLLAILRGLILAIPILMVFLVLLMTADLIFQARVEAALEWLDVERLVEYFGRALVVILGTVFFLGAVVAALRDPGERKLIGEDKPILKPFLGFIESVIVLGGVDLLFAVFVIIQFAYFFGGEANIDVSGYTYAEYARRGFGELVAVGVLSLGLILGLAAWTKREHPATRWWFNGLSALLILQVGVILASALTRLLLYEEAYGFTRLRTYTHIFIPWMGVLLVAFLVLLLVGRLRKFAVAVALGAMGFAFTLNLLNVDAFIVERNVARLEEKGRLDVYYLARLSEDAVPDLVELAGSSTKEVREELLPELACWNAQLETQMEGQTWPSTHLSRLAARDAFQDLQEDFASYEILQDDWGFWMIHGEDEEINCAHQSWDR